MSNLLKKVLFASALALGATVAHGQSILLYTTDFGTATTNTTPGTAASDGTTYIQEELTQNQTKTGSTLSGTGQGGWLTNDPDNTSTVNNATGPYLGGSNFVGLNAGGSNGANYFTGSSANLGGQRSTTAANDLMPTVATTYLYHPVTIPSTTTLYSFGVDFTVTSSAQTNPSFPTQDSFGFTLLNSAGGKLLSVNSGTTVTTETSNGKTTSAVSLGYEVGSSTSPFTVGNGVTISGVYHLSITVNPLTNTFSASYSGAGASATLASNVSLTPSGVVATSVSEFAATWTLSDATDMSAGGYTGAGSNIMAFDNYTIMIPEPSTYAMMGVGFLGLLGLRKLRHRQA